MSLRTKALLPLVFFSVLLIGYLYGLYMPRSLANIEANYQEATERHLDSVIEGLIPLLLARQLDTIYENLDALMKKNSNWVDMRLADGDGRSLYPLSTPSPGPGARSSEDVHVFTRRITYLDMNLGALAVRVDLAPLLAETRRRHQELVTIALFVILAFVLCAAFVLDRMVVEPVNALSRASQNLAQGNFSGPLPKGGEDEVGALVRRFGEMRDAIQGYQAELLERSRVLMRSEQILSEAQRIAHLGSWELDLGKNELRWSDEIYRIFGLRPQQFGATYEAFLDAVHPQDRDSVNNAYTRSVRENSPYDIIHRIVRKSDGAIRHVREQCEHLRNERGEVLASRGTVHDITEQKQAEEAIRESERKFRSISAAAQDAILMMDNDARISYWNPAAEKIFSYTAEEAMGRELHALLVPQRLHRAYRDGFERFRASGEGPVINKTFEATAVRRDGGEFPVELSISALKLKDRWNAVGIIRDITERKKAETESRRLASIVESSDDAIVSKTLDGIILTWNKAAETMYGYSADEVKGRSVSLLAPPDHQDDVPVILAQVGKGEHVYQYETVQIKKNGDRIHVSLTVSPLRDDSGAIIGASAIGRDITGQKKTAEELKFKNVLLSTQQETSLDGILAVDERGRIISYNRRFAELWGIPSEIITSGPDEFALQAVTDKLEDRESFLAEVKHLYAHREEKSRDELSLKDGRTLDRYSSPMTGPDGRYFGRVWYFRDITEQKKLEEQLRQAQKMEAIGQLAGGVAHDFNNILTAIIGYGNMLRMKMMTDDPLRINVDHVLESAERAAQLTHSLLAFSRKQVMDLKAVKLNEVISHLEKFLRRIIGEDIELKTILRGDVVVMADSGQLEQVLMNLATNARDAMSRGGQLTIETDQVSLEEDGVRMHGFDTPGTYAVISVTDTGCGMDDRTIQKIFEPFFTTKEVGRGTGLGMSIVYGIVRQHQGYINVYSQAGRGTTFRIYLPMHGAPAAGPGPSAELPPVRGGTETILLAEDDNTLRTLFTSLLTDFGYRVVVAEDGGEAVDKFQSRTGAIALCILDMIMPKMSGKEAYDRIRKQNPDVKALFMSGYTADRAAREGIPDGCEFIQKPVQPQFLLRKIRETLDRFVRT